MTPKEELKYYKKAHSREKLARKEAERILESKAEELYNANTKLLELNTNLEVNLIQRTEKIKTSEKELKQLVESANVMIYKTDINGDLTFINTTVEKISEYSSKELIGSKISDLAPKDQRFKLIRFYKNQLTNNIESTYYEYQIKSKWGKNIWIGQNVQLIMKDGLSVGLWAVARDITDKVKSHNELEKSNEKYKNLFEGTFDGVIRLDSKRCFVEWNSKMETMLGYNAEELNGMHITTVLYEEDIEKSKIYLATLLKNGFYTNYIAKIKSKSGKIIDIEVNSRATFVKGEITGSIDNVRDISERKSLDKAIIRSEEKYRGMIENLEFGLLEVDIHGIIVKAYPSFCRLTGYSQEEIIGSDPQLLLHPDFISLMNKKTKNRKEGKSDAYEIQIKHKSGDYIWVVISGSPFYNEIGELMGSIGVHLDISSQKKMEIDLIAANKEAMASSKAKELFLANMSHEIRTPLNAVFGLSNLLMGTKLGHDQLGYVENINNSAQILLLLVNDILDISKIESGKLEAHSTRFNLRKTIETILSSTSYLAKNKNLKLNLIIDDKLDEIYLGDELKICQVLINLVNNAIKFTHEGEVTLMIEKVNDLGTLHQIKISVNDTGKGIAVEALQSVFEDFSQEDNTILKKYGGTGLGLSISKKLVSILGGKLEVDSTINKGSTFHFKINLELTNDNNETIKRRNTPDINWSEIKILSAEDNLVNQFVIESTIKNWGSSTDHAINGEEAILMMRHTKYDIILMDMQMPIMDGITATQFIRKEMKSNIPIIAFTANAIKKDKERCLSAGMNDYITKPFQADILKSKIKNLLLNRKSDELIDLSETKRVNKNPLFSVNKLVDISPGDSEFIIKMLNIFHEDGKSQLQQIITSDNPEEISRLAHKIKPSIDYLSNSYMKNLVRQIEQKDFVDDENLLNEFILKLKQLIELSEEYINYNK